MIFGRRTLAGRVRRRAARLWTALVLGSSPASVEAQFFSAPEVSVETGVGIGGDVVNATITNVQGMPLSQVVQLVAALSGGDEAAQAEALTLLRAKMPATGGAQAEAVAALLRVLGEADVPPDALVARFEQIARRYVAMLERLEALTPVDAEAAARVAEARAAMAASEFARADALLTEAEEIELAAAEEAERLAQEALAAAEARRAAAAQARAERGRLAELRLDYRAARDHYLEAARLAPAPDDREHLRLAVVALLTLAQDRGDDAAAQEARSLTETRYLPAFDPVEEPVEHVYGLHLLASAMGLVASRRTGDEGLLEAAATFRKALALLPPDQGARERSLLSSGLAYSLIELATRRRDLALMREAAELSGDAVDAAETFGDEEDLVDARRNHAAALMLVAQEAKDAAMAQGALEALEDAVAPHDRAAQPVQWALALSNLGAGRMLLGKQLGDREMIVAGMKDIRTALSVQTIETAPLDRAMSLSNLGLALTELGIMDQQAAPLEEAVLTLRRSLEIYTVDRAPLRHAKVQDELGDALRMLGNGLRDPERLEEAGEAFEAAGKVLSSGVDPKGEADALRNYGEVQHDIGELRAAAARSEDARDAAFENRRKAAEALKAAAAIYRRIGREVDALETEFRLGRAVFAGGRGDAEALETAAVRFEAVADGAETAGLEGLRADALMDLGNARLARGGLVSGEAEHLSAADAFRDAGTIAAAAGKDLFRSRAAQRLAMALLELDIRRGGDAALLWEAAEAAERAQAGYAELDLRKGWAEAGNTLGVALLRLGALSGEGGAALYAQAVAVLDEVALDVSRAIEPVLWADTRYNLGSVTARLAQSEGDLERWDQARRRFQEARDAYLEGGRPDLAATAERALARLGR
ncbi:MAG: hypothetical protein AAF676_01885 [Pseudomonadota bacterium]